MITNKDIRVENGNLVLNGDKFPLDGQSPEAIMEIVEDNSDTTPTENSTAPITSGGVYTSIGTVNTAIGSVSDTIGDITQTGVTGASVAAQIEQLDDTKRPLSVSSSIIGSSVDVSGYDAQSSGFVTPHEGFVRFTGASNGKSCLVLNGFSVMISTDNADYKGMWLPKGVTIQFAEGTPSVATWFNCSEA